MPREPRIYIEKVLYLITARGIEDRDLFMDTQDYMEYLKSLAAYKREYGFKLFAYCLLPKRFCMLIELQNGVTISTIMHNLNSKYTKMYNSRYGKKGHLFQSRFKSILVEKNEYLLRMTRYIHLLPQEIGITNNVLSYPYSSYFTYTYEDCEGHYGLQLPHMADEVKEVFNFLLESGNNTEKQNSYEGYIRSADDKEIDIVQNLLHRTAFVGSMDFSETMRAQIKNHIIEEKKSRIVRKTNPGFIFAGSMVILFLSVTSYNFYNNQAGLQNTLNVTTSGFDVARNEMAKRVNTLQSAITGYEEKENHGLGGFAWELKLTPVQKEYANGSYKDNLQFKGGQVISAKFMAKGFAPFDYTISKQSHGKMIWETTQINPEGAKVRWYGIISGNNMRGILTESPACRQAGRFECKSRDFSFVSVRRVNDLGRVKNVVQ